jgi:hypothetical protein
MTGAEWPQQICKEMFAIEYQAIDSAETDGYLSGIFSPLRCVGRVARHTVFKVACVERRYSEDNYMVTAKTEDDLSVEGKKWLSEIRKHRDDYLREYALKHPKSDPFFHTPYAIKYDCEIAPKMKQGEALLKCGLIDPENTAEDLAANGDTMSEYTVRARLDDIVSALAFFNVYLTGTDTYTDIELLRLLLNGTLEDEVTVVPPNDMMVEWVSFDHLREGHPVVVNRQNRLPKPPARWGAIRA